MTAAFTSPSGRSLGSRYPRQPNSSPKASAEPMGTPTKVKIASRLPRGFPGVASPMLVAVTIATKIRITAIGMITAPSAI
jgi:hypothetical protein